MQFSVYQDSLIGGRRSNQDRMGYRYTQDALMLVVADGMGGHMRGDMAATIALQTMAAAFERDAKPYIKNPAEFLQESFLAAHREIHRYRAIQNLPETPRTTIVACVIQHGQAVWAHCGDSRLYWIRKGKILSCTRDHSHLEYLIAEGKIDPSERDTHPERNKLFNCLGAPALPDVEVAAPVNLEADDMMLLCSDGLWAVLPDSLLVQGLLQGTLANAVPALLKKAVVFAGETSDNATALALQWIGDDVAQTPAAPAEDTHTLLMTEFAPLPVADAPVKASGFEAEFAAEFGIPLSATIAPSAAAPDAIAAPTDAEIDQAVADLRAAIVKSSRTSR